jgi:aminodeoxyfutalosine deaminase
MAYQKLKADQLFNGYDLLGSEQVLVMKDDGSFENILPASEAGSEVKVFEGIISPGLINCHCHLELSHLKNIIPPHTGLIDFLCTVVTKRGFEPALIQQAMEQAEKEMYNNGIVAVADVCNTADTAIVKTKSNIRWQNFIEVLSLTNAKAAENIKHYQQVKKLIDDALKNANLAHRSSLVPHAPYTISPQTFELINEATKNQLITIHNQEHPAENDLYENGGGDFLKLFKIFGVNESPFPVTKKSSLRSYLPYFNQHQSIMLVHNTCTIKSDIEFAIECAKQNNITLSWCLCPNANSYIENKMPPLPLLKEMNTLLVLGTDSYSSNWQLSIVKEMQTLQKNFPEIALHQILQMGTLNGAKALQWQNKLGSFEKGKTPGVTLISSDLETSRKLM